MLLHFQLGTHLIFFYGNLKYDIFVEIPSFDRLTNV